MTPIAGSPLPAATLVSPSAPDGAAQTPQAGFGGLLSGLIGQAEGLEHQAEGQVGQLAAGTGDIAQTMLSLQEATLSIGFLAQVRDRVVSAYQALMSEVV